MAVHEIQRSARLDVTARLIRQFSAHVILEIGAAEFSFKDEANASGAKWLTVDTQGDCDILTDINAEHVRLPIDDESVDIVICTEVLEHLLWPQVVLRDICRVLKVGGRAVLSVPNMNSLLYRVAWAFGRLPSCAASGNLPLELGSTAYQIGGRLVGGHVVDFNDRRLRRLIEYCDLSVEQIVGCGLYWHRQIAPAWIVPPKLSSNLIAVACKP